MPSAELAPRPPLQSAKGGEVSLIHPDSGQLLDLTSAAPAALADWLDAVRVWEQNARTAKNVVSEELHRRMDANAKWTLRDGEFEIRGQSPDRSVYSEELRGALEALVAEGLISQEACDAAYEPVVTYKPRARGLNALRKLGGKVAEVIAEHTLPDQRPRRITISRRVG